MQLSDGTQLDPGVVKVMRALRSIESGNGKGEGANYNAVGDNGTSTGAFQWNNGKIPVPKGGIPANFQSDAKTYGFDPNDFSPANQNKVMYHKIKAQKDSGLDPEEIAALHNGASKDPTTGKYIYNAPEYGVKFRTALAAQKDTETPEIPAGPKSQEGIDLSMMPVVNGGVAPSTGIIPQMIKGAIDLPTSVGGGFMNAIRAGGREMGADMPAQTSIPSLSGNNVAPIGYNEQGQELSPWQTTKQAAGAGAEALSYAAAPELKFLASAGKATPLVSQLMKGGLKTGVQGAEYAGGQSLRENPEDTLGALKSTGLGFLGGAALGTGLAGTGAIANKITGTTGKLESDLLAAQGDEVKFKSILNDTPEGQTYLKSLGAKTADDLTKINDKAYNDFTKGVEEYYATNNSKAKKITANTSKEDLHTVMEYADKVPFKAEGKKLNTLDTSRAIEADQKKVGESMSSILDGMEMAGIDTSLPKDYAEKAVKNELDRIAATPRGAAINKDLAFKQITNMIDNQEVGDTIPMKTQHTLKVAANKRYPITDADKSTKEAAGEALGNVIRNYHDSIIEAGAQNGSIDATAVKAYKDLNDVWGKLDRAKEATDIIAKTTKSPGRLPFLPEITGGIVSGGFNPIVYWGTQAATRSTLNALDRAILSSRYGVSGIKATPSDIQGLLKGVEEAKAKIAQHIENNTAEKMGAEASIQAAKDAIAKHGLPATPPALEPIVPDNQLPTIDMGPTAKSKYNVIDKNLPTIRGFAKPSTMLGMTALTGLLGLGEEAQKKFGTETYTAQSTPQLIKEEPKIPGIIDGIDIRKYATDPQHEIKVEAIHSKLPPIATSTDAQNYIDHLKNDYGHKIKVTGDMIYKAAKEYGVSMKLMIALMQNDSMFATTGLGKKTNNPGNINNTDTGNKQYYPSLREGVRAVARQLARYKVQQAQ